MNPPSPSPEPDDRLARAEAALKGTPVPEGPSNDLIARTRTALGRAASSPDPNPMRSPMITMLKFAAAASVITAVASLPFLVPMPRAGAGTTFAEVAKKLQDAHTLSYQFSVSVPGQDRPTTGREYLKAPGLTRTESDVPQASVTIVDAAVGKILSLDPATKTAILQDWKLDGDVKRRLESRPSDTAKHLRALANKEGEPVGHRKIGDVDAEGFRVEDEGTTWTIWVDAERRLPMLMETTYRFQEHDVPATLSDFRIDPPLDDALFRLDPPDDYALREVDVPIAIGEEALVNLLRLYAEASDGAFPPKPDDTAAFQEQFPEEKWEGPDDPRMIRLVQSMAASTVFLQFELKNDYGYAPDGVKLGDADKVLFWYRPKGSQEYRAIFGDLHTEEVAEDRLPEKPKP